MPKEIYLVCRGCHTPNESFRKSIIQEGLLILKLPHCQRQKSQKQTFFRQHFELCKSPLPRQFRNWERERIAEKEGDGVRSLVKHVMTFIARHYLIYSVGFRQPACFAWHCQQILDAIKFQTFVSQPPAFSQIKLVHKFLQYYHVWRCLSWKKLLSLLRASTW